MLGNVKPRRFVATLQTAAKIRGIVAGDRGLGAAPSAGVSPTSSRPPPRRERGQACRRFASGRQGPIERGRAGEREEGLG
jgi:hypothetical protein